MKCIKSRFFRAFMHFLFSHIGLCILVSMYCVLGALLFMYFEADLERQALNESRTARCEAEIQRDELIEQVIDAYNSGDMQLDAMQQWVDDFHFVLTRDEVLQAYRHSTGNCDAKPFYEWTFPSAVLFTVTTIALIGYGNITPTTDLSQFVLICYSLIGIPLTLMFLTNVGRLFASAIRVMFSHGVCYFCWKRRNRNRDGNTRMVLVRRRVVGQTGGTLEAGGSGTSDQFVDGSRANEDVQAEIALETKLEMQRRDRLQMVVPKSFLFSIMALYAFLGTLLFAWSENWTFIESAYFNVVTLMTIGLGDFVPRWNAEESIVGKIAMCLSGVYIMLGLGILFMGLNVMVDELMTASAKAGKKIGLVKEDTCTPARSNLERAVRRQVY